MVTEILKAIFFGIVEGITEWLPISSTGHMILLNEFVKLQVSDEFYKLFEVVIQLGAILAVILLFFHKLNPFSPSKSAPQKRNTWRLWFKVVLAVIPSAVIGLPLDDWMDAHFYNYVVVAITLIVYGIAFLFVERENSHRRAYANSVYDIDLKTAMLIGCFQCLSLIPGTSRSGSTILGAIILGVGRAAGAEFSFFLAIPTMLGASVLKLVKFLLSGVSATDHRPMLKISRVNKELVKRLFESGRLRGFLRGQPACHQGSDGICTQAQLCGIRCVPHHSGGTGSGIFCLPNPARIKIT